MVTLRKFENESTKLSEILQQLVEIENKLEIEDELEKAIFETLSEADYNVAKAIRLIDLYNRRLRK